MYLNRLELVCYSLKSKNSNYLNFLFTLVSLKMLNFWAAAWWETKYANKLKKSTFHHNPQWRRFYFSGIRNGQIVRLFEVNTQLKLNIEVLHRWQFHQAFSGLVKKLEVAQFCETLCDPKDCSLAGSSVHGIFQARVLEWVVISFSRGSSWPRDWTQVSCTAGRRFILWATKEAPSLINVSPNKVKVKWEDWLDISF